MSAHRPRLRTHATLRAPAQRAGTPRESKPEPRSTGDHGGAAPVTCRDRDRSLPNTRRHARPIRLQSWRSTGSIRLVGVSGPVLLSPGGRIVDLWGSRSGEVCETVLPRSGPRCGCQIAPQQTTERRGRDASYLAPPAQIRTCSFPAYGSHLGYPRQLCTAVCEPASVTAPNSDGMVGSRRGGRAHRGGVEEGGIEGESKRGRGVL